MDAGKTFAQIRELVAQVRNAFVRDLLFAFLDDPSIREAFLVAPAAKAVHHAYAGGLCEHTLSVIELGWRICDHYPQLDRDLITAGCLLHDIGKVREFGADREYTEEGRLIGHLILTCQWIREKAARIPDFPRELEVRITHLVVAHHGKIEHGSPREPATLEAFVVHALDDLDTRISSVAMIAAASPEPGAWTDRKNMYGRKLLRPVDPVPDPRRLDRPGLYREES
jgi:3'-5' exoribonuclease